ncbi:MAG: hypothetical protein K0U60_02865 [Actinomycetia bacterium]|nr:hypothetical protein [Actinomycetes bacterium]MCH9800693.1 hypothetical protein [Actinomycetes bacterium]
MNLGKVIFGFFVLLAATLNFGFFIGDIGDPDVHNGFELFAALVVSLIVTILKLGDRTQMGAALLAASLVADLQLILATTAYAYYENAGAAGFTTAEMSTIVSLSGGALVANLVSVVLLIVETSTYSRR